MNKKSPFWHTKLNNNIFYSLRLLSLSLITVIALIYILFQGDTKNVLLILTNIIIIFTTFYTTNIIYNLIFLKIRNKMVFRASFNIKFMIAAMLIALFMPVNVPLYLLTLSFVVMVLKLLANKYLKTLYFDLGLGFLALIYLLGFVFDYQMTPLIFSYTNLAYLITGVSLILLIVLMVLKLVKPKLLVGLLVTLSMLVMILNYFDYLMFNNILILGLIPYFVFITIGNEITPTVPKSMVIYITLNILLIGLGSIYFKEYILTSLLWLNFVLGLARNYLDIIGLKSNN